MSSGYDYRNWKRSISQKGGHTLQSDSTIRFSWILAGFLIGPIALETFHNYSPLGGEYGTTPQSAVQPRQYPPRLFGKHFNDLVGCGYLWLRGALFMSLKDPFGRTWNWELRTGQEYFMIAPVCCERLGSGHTHNAGAGRSVHRTK